MHHHPHKRLPTGKGHVLTIRLHFTLCSPKVPRKGSASWHLGDHRDNSGPGLSHKLYAGNKHKMSVSHGNPGLKAHIVCMPQCEPYHDSNQGSRWRGGDENEESHNPRERVHNFAVLVCPQEPQLSFASCSSLYDRSVHSHPCPSWASFSETPLLAFKKAITRTLAHCLAHRRDSVKHI